MQDYYKRRICWKGFFSMVFLGTIFIVLAAGGAVNSAETTSIEGKVTIVDNQGKPKDSSAGVVIFLDELEHPTSIPAVSKQAAIQQINKEFVPKVLPVVVGTTVSFPNDDTVYHNVFSLSKTKPFDLGIYRQGESKSVTFDNPGLIKVYCNIHPQMVSYILVLTNPHFTVTDSEGRFRLDSVPLGKAILRTWFPGVAESPEHWLTVSLEGIYDLNLTLMENIYFKIREETVTIEHKNKWGQDYPGQY